MPIALGQVTNEYTKLEIIELSQIVDRVVFQSDEVTALCPVTSQRDFYQVTITLVATGITIESKTLKLFLASLTTTPIFAEELASHILVEVVESLTPIADTPSCPSMVQVSTFQKSRGGITIETVSSWESNF